MEKNEPHPGTPAAENPEEATAAAHRGSNVESVTEWILQAGEGQTAAQEGIWRAYFNNLAKYARTRLSSRVRRVADEDDVAASALMSFYEGLEKGRFTIRDRGDLWRLLVTIAGRKAVATARRVNAKKRGGGALRGESVFFNMTNDARGDLANNVATHMTPDMEVAVEDLRQHLLEILDDDVLRRVATLRLEGRSCEEIATELACVPRTITRKLDLIRSIWNNAEAG